MSNIRATLMDFSPTECRNVANKENKSSPSPPVLTLVQFSRPPFVSFGTVKLGSSKSALLRIENPVEYATEVRVDRVASAKGFSVEESRFTIEVRDWGKSHKFIATVRINWTPVQEGGVRELITFTANGIVKHQAILLGRAEAQKKKKVTFTWVWGSRYHTVLATNKTFHVSRQSQYKKEREAAVVLQRRYRERQMAQHQRQQYIRLRQAAVKLQSAYRGSKVRRDLMRMHQASTLIQAYFRMYKARILFTAARCAATVIQQNYRAYIKGRQQRQCYLQMRESAVVIQSAFRGMKTRIEVQGMHRAATVIQAHYRKHKQFVHFKKLRWAASVICQRFKAVQLRNTEVQKYMVLKTATVRIQCAFRGMRTRKQVREMHNAARIIQRRYLAHRDRKKYLTLKAAAITIQQQYRALTAARMQRKSYQSLVAACVLIQATYKGMKVRKDLQRKNHAATVIQASFRRYRTVLRFKAMKLAANVIQQWYRSQLKGKQTRERFLKLRHSAVVVQSVFRGRKARLEIRRMHSAAVLLQAQFRMQQCYLQFKKMCYAAKVIQDRYRASKARDLLFQEYKAKKKAAVVIQSSFRNYKARQKLEKAATVIQRSFLTFKARKHFLSLRAATLVLQYQYRALVAVRTKRAEYLLMRKAVVTLQAAYRGMQARKELRRQHKAAVAIQTQVRQHLAMSSYKRLRWAANAVQQRYRANKMMNMERQKLNEQKHATLLIQAAFRGMKARQHVRRMHQAACNIQRAFRVYCAHKQYLALKSAAVTIQLRYRAMVASRKQRGHYHHIRHASIILQAAYRAMRLSALIIQRHYRSFLRSRWERLNFVRLRNAVISVQSAFRRQRQLVAFRRLRWATCVLQERLRAQRMRDDQVKQYTKIRWATVCIQAAFRAKKARQAASIVIQNAFRRHCARIHFRKMQVAALLIQRWYKSCQLAKKKRAAYLAVRRATVTLQSAFRGMLARRMAYCVRSAIKIQSVLHMFMYRKRFLNLRSSTVKIQASCRMFIARRQFLAYRSAAIILQKHYKTRQVMRKQRACYLKALKSVRTIQACLRGHIERRKFSQLKKSEAQARRRQLFTAFVYHHLCAVKIQRALRAHWALESAKKQICSVICIQRWFRTWAQRRRYLEQQRKIITLQRAVKGWLSRRNKAATVIQQAARKYLLKRQGKRLQGGIIKAQALWRGHCSRRLNDTSKIIAMRHRFRKVNLAVKEEDKLCNKTAIAIDYLLKYKHFSYILAALKHLETATRLSPECCEHLVESGATLIIFTLIRSCNRSVPCMEVITYAIQVLLNLSKYEKTTEAVYGVEDSVETLLDLLQIYREKAGDKVADKGGSIFTKTCFLLIILLHDKQRALVRMNFLGSHVKNTCTALHYNLL
uniref:Abnormal spindle-like microcephaly-associated protein ASH domain-containing protein n=1 Tax=Scleropages formosus TaxID=113540 RepID=A0A8C9R525_SCLFO